MIAWSVTMTTMKKKTGTVLIAVALLCAAGAAGAEEGAEPANGVSTDARGPGSSLEINVPSPARKAPSRLRKVPQTEILRGYDSRNDTYGDTPLTRETPDQ